MSIILTPPRAPRRAGRPLTARAPSRNGFHARSARPRCRLRGAACGSSVVVAGVVVAAAVVSRLSCPPTGAWDGRARRGTRPPPRADGWNGWLAGPGAAARAGGLLRQTMRASAPHEIGNAV
eukprot:scaffold121_cov412-Prasinococcus_capsulatus_cf.AAC.11